MAQEANDLEKASAKSLLVRAVGEKSDSVLKQRLEKILLFLWAFPFQVGHGLKNVAVLSGGRFESLHIGAIT